MIVLLALHTHTADQDHMNTDKAEGKSSETVVNCLDHVTFTDRTQRSWSESRLDSLHLESP